ncbi:MAG: hypothetical protein N5P05_001925 [Chroococcopsis gigantea SAG 12.99]|jgi:uncharacterized protein (DUF2252 family)|nr:DUF2252 family protein [Chlorogloea purpurea SAG 13.99]MDV3000319.1 hypothetical protein [Chroococcopsis gigantea SAG 12.99]
MAKDVKARIEKFNEGRNRDLLDYKYEAMRKDSLIFFRGSCHLFYEDFPKNTGFDSSPLGWITGDAHLENFGVYKSNDRQVYFDLNDFDEGCLAPISWEIARFLTSIYLVFKVNNIDEATATELAQKFLSHYCQYLGSGKAKHVEEALADHITGYLFQQVEKRRRKDFLDKRTEVVNGTRIFKIPQKKIFPLDPARKTTLKNLFDRWAQQQKTPAFFKVHDIAIRLAGTGSIGLKRYIFLVEGNGSPDDNYLIDMKQCPSSSLSNYITVHQPVWSSQAERIISIQTRMQYETPALLSSIDFEGSSFQIKELQPQEDKLDFDEHHINEAEWPHVLKTMSNVLASAQLRSSGRQGSAIADDLISFGKSQDWQEPLLEYSRQYAKQVEEDYDSFCQSFTEK